MSDTRTTLSKALMNARRSQRIAARIRVQVRRRTDGDSFMSEVSYTLVVNVHGALIALTMKVQANELLAIKNMNSAEERQGRVVRVGKEEGASQTEVAIEFTEPAPRFWHIDFPPADWKAFDA
jgi:triphosphoribosyl-dephospho-CoA synthetase